MTDSPAIVTEKGSPYPLGVSIQENFCNFSLVSTSAHTVSLILLNRNTEQAITEIPLSPKTNKTGDVWHIAIKNIPPDSVYAYRVSPSIKPEQDLLLDPYAKCTSTTNEWNKLSPLYRPLGECFLDSTFDWGDDTPPKIPLNELIIYEMHVRGFTIHPSSQVKNPGTFLGVIEKIPHLIELGVNAVELLPVHEFNEIEYRRMHPSAPKNDVNFWGYSTVNFFSPMNRYASSSAPGAAVNEFKTMVKALHKNGIEVILDVVFNHTAEGGKTGPVLSFKGIDNKTYYLLDDKGEYLNYSGCGNSINANNPVVLEMIVASLRYWVAEMHVDGFRFDLASALTRGPDGSPLDNAPLIEAITKDPILANVNSFRNPGTPPDCIKSAPSLMLLHALDPPDGLSGMENIAIRSGALSK